ncbi:inositol-trisphosphate 3-kinase B isoform X2 [Aethina tumida]|nr:inositol-trisphosphate 3-kinase B isoform X2 [Aethina tumida]XP_049826155.1 inositol-trisphosphate 3-kinase B isoform X2 [Aethina tumida]
MDLRDVVKNKAEKHRNFYERLIENDSTKDAVATDAQMASRTPDESADCGGTQGVSRQRKQGVHEMQTPKDTITFQSVRRLRDNYTAMLEKKNKENLKHELVPPPNSGYCSSTASNNSDDEKGFVPKANVRRCGSNDSAMGQSDDDGVIGSNWGEKCEPAGEQYEEENRYPYSPYSPRGSIDHSNVPSRTLIEAQYVPIVDRKLSDSASVSEVDPVSDSRRESCVTDDGDETRHYRYWRTPSVVVSDYSDDIMGFSLEDLEYIRSRKENSSSPDSSLHSSCSNLNYCGSTISGLDTEYVLAKPFRKSSNCSTCSTLSGDEDGDSLHPYKKEPSGWRKLRNIVQWTPFFQTYRKQRYPWVQLAGHQGNFKAGPDQGTILKKLCPKEEKCFKILMKDVLRPYVPEYKGLVVSEDGECSYIQLQDLLGDFVSPCVMDCKIGVRTYLEEELAKAKEKPKLRKDMYEKMCQIDQDAPTEEEHRAKGVTKPRYMVWRETISSTATLGFRIEGIRNADGSSSKDFKTTKTKEQIIKAFESFTDGFPHAITKYIQRLQAIKATLESSEFFNTHEIIGSSLLFVHDRYTANVWLIDFAKTISLPENVKIDHNSSWRVGNHEDGYLVGVNNLIKIFKTMCENQPVAISPPLSLQDPKELEDQELKQEST